MKETVNEWYTIENVDEIDSPALVVYAERVKENIRTAKEMIGDVNRLRPHAKTHKAAEATRLLIEAGIQKFKCATVAEAEMLALAGAPDVLLAYQPVGPKLQRFITLIKHYPQTRFSCLTDNEFSVTEIATAAISAELILRVYIDINAGMNRTGILPGKLAAQLYTNCTQREGITPVGFHLYDGHINYPDLYQRTSESNRVFERVDEMQKELTGNGYGEPVIIAGGTPTFPVHVNRENVECSPGTFIYWDRGYQIAYPEQKFLPSALVITRVVSLPDKTKICLDLGHKSVAAENELGKRIYFLNAPNLIPLGQSEEHLVMQIPEGHVNKIGDVLYGLPFHICPTCALYERALIVENGRVNGEWKIIARDRKIKY